MILIGTMNLARTKETGSFHCPNCNGTESYRLRAKRTFLTIYFIPTVPVTSAEPYVQCDECRSIWDVNVLEIDRSNPSTIDETQFRDEALRASILTVLIDGRISEVEIETLIQMSGSLLLRPVDREELGELCSIAMSQNIRAEDYVLTSSQRWDEPQRRVALQAMFLAASAEGELSPAKINLLARLREMFALSDSEYEETIEAALLVDPPS